MGQAPLTLPPAGTVYIDTQVLIYTVERHPSFSPVLATLWQAAQDRRLHVATSDLTLMEVLVSPLRRGDSALQQRYESVLFNPDTRLVPITQSVLRRAAGLRASTPTLRTPDAIHAASAIDAGCTLFLTNDVDFRRVMGLPVTILRDAVVP